MFNRFGNFFTFTSFGESHGKAIGVSIDGVPSNIKLDESFIQSELDRRKPGRSFTTPRKEDDKFEILSGAFDGFTTGTTLTFIVYNNNQKSKDYSDLKDTFRPNHADFTYEKKYHIRDYKGGGRSSARETVARVIAGAVAKLVLKELGIEIFSGVSSIGEVEAKNIDFEYAKGSAIYFLDKSKEQDAKDVVNRVLGEKDSIGASVFLKATGLKAGFGEPVYKKLDAIIAEAMVGINGVKSVLIGEDLDFYKLQGSHFNDEMKDSKFLSNNSSGIIGGISNSNDIIVRVFFKPTPTIGKAQQTIDKFGKNVTLEAKGRHDPCIGIRGSIVAEAMLSVVLLDSVLMGLGRRVDVIKKLYKEI